MEKELSDMLKYKMKLGGEVSGEALALTKTCTVVQLVDLSSRTSNELGLTMTSGAVFMELT